MKVTESREELFKKSIEDLEDSCDYNLSALAETFLTPTEKKFLLCAEKGDIPTLRSLLIQFEDRPDELNINCTDSLRRSALVTAIENENMDLIKFLLKSNIKVKDALLHAIKEEFVEAVEVLLEWEEKIHVDGEPYSWEAVDSASATFTPDITPLILAAHTNNYEILKILLDRGATLPRPHNVRCGCDECLASSEADSLRHSQARINAYKALSSSSLISLSSRDPLLTAFELSWELKNLSYCEAEYRSEYNEMRQATQDFATALLDHARTSGELEVMLNYNPNGDIWEPGERHTLERLKLAIKYKQKKFVAHPNVQQLLASIWYDGLPGFRRKSTVRQITDVLKLACLFPFYSCIYMIAPNSKMGLFVKKPFVKFIFHSSSYAFFLLLLGLASQRAENTFLELLAMEIEWLHDVLAEWKRKERGSWPGVVESALYLYIISLIYSEVRALWTNGLKEYMADLWNIVDFITNCFYLVWIGLRFTAIYIVMRESNLGLDPYIPREQWHPFDPMLLSEGAFAGGMILSFLKLVHVFSVNPHLGPLQISLGRMIIDILKFFFIYMLVLVAFGCGINQLLWYYSNLEKVKCFGEDGTLEPDFDNNEKACTVWRRFANLFETSQSLFWASFGLVDLTSFDLVGINSFTRFWSLLLFGCYSVINIIVLLNMLIAMMSNSYQIISERSDIEWKFARSHLWMSYFDDGDTLPPPFNLLPTMKTLLRIFKTEKNLTADSFKVKSMDKARKRHELVMNNLIARYVTAEQRKRCDYGITEDDVIEIRQDISSLRYELVHILRANGMKTPEMNPDQNLVTKKGKIMERRLEKDFRIGIVEGIIHEFLSSDKDSLDIFGKIAKVFNRKRNKSKKQDWNTIVRKSSYQKNLIGSSEERRERLAKQSVRRYIIEKLSSSEALDPEKLVQYNPQLLQMAPAARIAYTKFSRIKITREFAEQEKIINEEIEEEKHAEELVKLTHSSTERKKDEEQPPNDTTDFSIVRPRPQSRSNSKLMKLISIPSKEGTETKDCIIKMSEEDENETIVTVENEIKQEKKTSSISIQSPPSLNDVIPTVVSIESPLKDVKKFEPVAAIIRQMSIKSITTSPVQKSPPTDEMTPPTPPIPIIKKPEMKTDENEENNKFTSLDIKGSRSPLADSSRGRSKVTGEIISGWL
ncbi:transient receptor potential protein, putative [Pediculus humanus corporis]|uniref:Transient receptor potential protein, putative n=1 Tax=Pediculus humanus subsp. corporis TaxID=121224 RepID=E0VB86_PEDHC|nr:transient receptor potential protein, putative [Pediculus humanus corporis]EEB10642.1 transient receptor potential protein, putative [Pediculus humanus corporis]